MAEGLLLDLQLSGPIPLDFKLSVARGETMALTGPSGAGKTTVLRCIAGLMHPSAGSIHCAGQAWLDTEAGIHQPAQARRVGFVFQSYALFPHKTALENIMEAMLDLPAKQRRADAERLIAHMQLQGLEARYPAELSGGQKQRVALARALARAPEVLLLDEPFSAVDHPTRSALHRALALVRQTSDLPVLLVTHDIEDAARIADSLCLMRDGSVVEVGPAARLLADQTSALSRWMNAAPVDQDASTPSGRTSISRPSLS